MPFQILISAPNEFNYFKSFENNFRNISFLYDFQKQKAPMLTRTS